MNQYHIFPGGAMVRNLPANAGDVRKTGLIPGSGRSPGKGSGNPLQYSCLKNPMDRGAWPAIIKHHLQNPLGLISANLPGQYHLIIILLLRLRKLN